MLEQRSRIGLMSEEAILDMMLEPSLIKNDVAEKLREAMLSKKEDDNTAERDQAKADKKRIRQLERELNRKEKALAEAAALLVLRKKLNAYWGDDGEVRALSGGRATDSGAPTDISGHQPLALVAIPMFILVGD